MKLLTKFPFTFFYLISSASFIVLYYTHFMPARVIGYVFLTIFAPLILLVFRIPFLEALFTNPTIPLIVYSLLVGLTLDKTRADKRKFNAIFGILFFATLISVYIMIKSL